MADLNDRYLFRGKRYGLSKTPYGDGWTVGHLIETPKVTGRSGYSIVTLSKVVGYNVVSDDVDPATIGQCTGLKDKNDTLIFEGDILGGEVELHEFNFATLKAGKRTGEYQESRCIVEWSDTERGFKTLDVYPRMGKVHGSLKIAVEFYTVIGNIHDNPELLGGAA